MQPHEYIVTMYQEKQATMLLNYNCVHSPAIRSQTSFEPTQESPIFEQVQRPPNFGGERCRRKYLHETSDSTS